VVKISSRSDKRLQRKTFKLFADKQTNGPKCNTLSSGEGKYTSLQIYICFILFFSVYRFMAYHQQIEKRCLQSLNTIHELKSFDALGYTWNSGTYDVKMYQEVGTVCFNFSPSAP